jgi:hypothetical protein
MGVGVSMVELLWGYQGPRWYPANKASRSLQTNSEYGSETVNSAVRELDHRNAGSHAPSEGMCRGYHANCQGVSRENEGTRFCLSASQSSQTSPRPAD